MAYFRNNSTNQVLDSKIYVVNKSSIPVKVNGLGPGGKPLIIKPTPEYVVSVQQKSISNQAEQTLIITGNEVGSAVLYGYVDIGSNSALPGCSPTQHKFTGCISPLFVEVVPRMELPDLNTEEGAIARMLIAENITPDDSQGRYKEEDSLKAMQWMLIVLENRRAFSHPHLLQVPSNSASLTSIIRNGGVVQGFKDYPDLGGEQKRTIDSVRERANIGTDRKFLQYRSYMKNAISVAQREKVGIDPCPTKLYAWVKADSRSPGSNFVKFQTFAGQDFYTLTPGFLQDPLHPKK